jgi:hypothetical protein
VASPPADWQATRAAWNDANALRTGVSALAFVLYWVALVLHPTRSQ